MHQKLAVSSNRSPPPSLSLPTAVLLLPFFGVIWHKSWPEKEKKNPAKIWALSVGNPLDGSRREPLWAEQSSSHLEVLFGRIMTRETQDEILEKVMMHCPIGGYWPHILCPLSLTGSFVRRWIPFAGSCWSTFWREKNFSRALLASATLPSGWSLTGALWGG